MVIVTIPETAIKFSKYNKDLREIRVSPSKNSEIGTYIVKIETGQGKKKRSQQLIIRVNSGK
jgi:hypothetical protein